jgi:cytochrome b561
MVGGVISGYCVVGSAKYETEPPKTKRMERTAAKMGLSMKYLGIIVVYLSGKSGRRWPPAFGRIRV